MSKDIVISVSEKELIVSLYADYMIMHHMKIKSLDDARMSIKAFSDYIQQYLIDRYNEAEEDYHENRDSRD